MDDINPPRSPWHLFASGASLVVLPLVLLSLALFDRSFLKSSVASSPSSSSSSSSPPSTKDWIYEDKDGSGSASSASSKWQRAVAALCGAGLMATVIVKLVRTPVFDSTTLAWAFVVALAFLFSATARTISRFNVGAAAFVAIVPLLASQTFGTIALDPSSASFLLSISQLALGMVLAIMVVSVRRRPYLFREGRLIDERNSSSLLSQLTFAWAWPVLQKGRQNKKLEEDDLHGLDHSMRSSTLLSRLFGSLASGTRLWIPLVKDHARLVGAQSLIVVIRAIVLYIPPVALNKLLHLLEQPDRFSPEVLNQVYAWATLIVVATFVSVFLEAWDEWLTWSLLDMAVTAQLYAVIFDKCLRMEDSKKPEEYEKDEDEGAEEEQESSEDDDNKEDKGKGSAKRNVVNLLGTDVERVSNFTATCTLLPTSILEAILGVAFLINIIGWKSTAAGLVIPLTFYPLHRWSGKAYYAAEERAQKIGDEKTHKLTEVIHAIKQIKFSAAEDRWQKFIMDVRSRELKLHRSTYLIEIIMTFVWDATPIFLGAASLTTYALINNELPASVAFSTVAALELLQFSMSVIPHSLVQLLDARVSMRRIEDHLARIEKQDYIQEADTIKFKDATLAWTVEDTSSEEHFTLSHVNLEFPLKKISVITGASGSGKSLLLAGLAGEAALMAGQMFAPIASSEDDHVPSQSWLKDSAKAFVAQSPWLENASVRDNILFGQSLDQKRYEDVIYACALEDDLKALEDGDDTEVGALGINLSGGQRLRLTLARALYSRAGILVLDDVFSAVDAHVGRHLLEQALLGNLCRDRTIIVATHHAELVTPAASYVVRLTDGDIQGHHQVPSQLLSPNTQDSVKPLTLTVDTPLDDGIPTPVRHAPKKFVEDEARESGAVKGQVYRRYIQAAGGFSFWSLIISLFLIAAGLDLARSYIVKIWTQQSDETELAALTQHRQDNLFYISLFVGVSVISTVFITFKLYVLFTGTLRASKTLFEDLAGGVLRAPLRWIEKVPAGRLLNRFVGDFDRIDSGLGDDFNWILSETFALVTIITSAVIVSIWMAIPAVLLLVAAFGITFFYLPGAREVKRLGSTLRSPVFDHLNSVLAGLATIRTFDRAASYKERMDALIDAYTATIFGVCLTSAWLTIRQGFLGVIFLICVLAFLFQSGANASLTGFVLSFALSYDQTVTMWIWKYSSLEIHMNATERVLEYTDVPAEGADGDEPDADWPTQGAVSVSNLTVAYEAGLPPVLKDVSFSIQPRERIGIVGRTGSGKSTLILALFRFLEQRSGSISIDDVDISSMPLHSLRKRLSLIPQDPVLFTGTLRSNLDPFHLFTDEELLDVLRHVSLLSTDESGISSLSHAISRGGANVSQGQRQLICLARAMLERPRVMMLDEATSAVDFGTDEVIQRNLRERFSESTLVVIAHRLGTIIDFDKVLVMGEGRVLEFGSPGELIEAGGVFAGMVRSSGEDLASRISS